MPAPKGNEYWRLVENLGKPAAYTPDELLQEGKLYIEWAESNPLYETKAFASNGIVVTENIPKMRAMSVLGFCVFANITSSMYYRYRDNEAYRCICEALEGAFRNQKFEGASAGLLNAAIISRDLGLVDKSEVNQIGVTAQITVSDADAKGKIDDLISKFNAE